MATTPTKLEQVEKMLKKRYDEYNEQYKSLEKSYKEETNLETKRLIISKQGDITKLQTEIIKIRELFYEIKWGERWKSNDIQE